MQLIRYNGQSRRQWRLPSNVVDLIYAEIFKPVPDAEIPFQLHLTLQHRLEALGERLGYDARLEACMGKVDDKMALVDVVWTARDGGRSVAIEIDTQWNQRSIAKLLHLAPTHLPVWIYLGLAQSRRIEHDGDTAKIHLLRVNAERLSARPRVLLPSTTDPLARGPISNERRRQGHFARVNKRKIEAQKCRLYARG